MACAALILLSGFGLAAEATGPGNGAEAEYMGGTLDQLAAGASGRALTPDPESFVFTTKKTTVRIPYERINLLEYGQKVDRRLVNDPGELRALIREHLLGVLEAAERPVTWPAAPPLVVMMVGVNGSGKTTTTGKLAARFAAEGKTVMMAAADTFRAAAIEQLEVWAGRSGAEFIRQSQGADPSAVVFDALQAARARKTGVVLIDTAGRLHTKSNLMAELEKMRRTSARVLEGAPHEVWLVLDATTGQNGLEQARKFTETAGVTGLILTKLDGTAKGGIVVSITRELNLPIRYIGVGEQAEDLLPFEPEKFISSLFES